MVTFHKRPCRDGCIVVARKMNGVPGVEQVLAAIPETVVFPFVMEIQLAHPKTPDVPAAGGGQTAPLPGSHDALRSVDR